MELEEVIKYIVWIVFFAAILGGLYFMLKNVGAF